MDPTEDTEEISPWVSLLCAVASIVFMFGWNIGLSKRQGDVLPLILGTSIIVLLTSPYLIYVMASKSPVDLVGTNVIVSGICKAIVICILGELYKSDTSLSLVLSSQSASSLLVVLVGASALHESRLTPVYVTATCVGIVGSLVVCCVTWWTSYSSDMPVKLSDGFAPMSTDDSIDEENPFAAVRQEQDRKKLAIKNAAARANACISRKYTAICGIVVAGIPWGVAMLVDWHAVGMYEPIAYAQASLFVMLAVLWVYVSCRFDVRRVWNESLVTTLGYGVCFCATVLWLVAALQSRSLLIAVAVMTASVVPGSVLVGRVVWADVVPASIRGGALLVFIGVALVVGDVFVHSAKNAS